MREKFNHMYLDSHERKLLIHSLVELKNQLIQQGRLCFVNSAYFGRIRTLIPATSGQRFGIIRTA